MSTRSIGEPTNRGWDPSGHTEAELEFLAPGSYVFKSSGFLGTLKRTGTCDPIASRVMLGRSRFKHKDKSRSHTQLGPRSDVLRLIELVNTRLPELPAAPPLTVSHRTLTHSEPISEERRQELYAIGRKLHRTLAAHRFNEATGGTPPPSP